MDNIGSKHDRHGMPVLLGAMIICGVMIVSCSHRAAQTSKEVLTEQREAHREVEPHEPKQTRSARRRILSRERDAYEIEQRRKALDREDVDYK